MKILFIAKHNGGDADPEGAITDALRHLGHEVTPIHEQDATYLYIQHTDNPPHPDLVLFLKWDNPSVLTILRSLGIPSCFWYFDLVDAKDPLVSSRSQRRIDWMQRIIPLVDLGFMTDGDWVDKWNNDWCESKSIAVVHGSDPIGPLIHLMQGADQRVIGPSKRPYDSVLPQIPILFLGTSLNGTKRSQWVEWMRTIYGPLFHEFGAKYRHGRQYEWPVSGRELAHLIARSKVVIAPDGPQTDLYWSNRVYLTLGFGAFLLHPYCKRLEQHYTHDKEIVYYTDRENMRSKIEYALYAHGAGEYRGEIANAAYLRTAKEHTYIQRCEQLLTIVKERLGVS